MIFPDRIDSKFRFVLLCASRAEQMMRGAKAKVESGRSKPGRVAMHEIRQGAINWDYGPAPVPEAGEQSAVDELET